MNRGSEHPSSDPVDNLELFRLTGLLTLRNLRQQVRRRSLIGWLTLGIVPVGTGLALAVGNRVLGVAWVAVVVLAVYGSLLLALATARAGPKPPLNSGRFSQAGAVTLRMRWGVPSLAHLELGKTLGRPALPSG